MKFKIGDMVIGNEKANQYSITSKGWIGQVTDVSGNSFEANNIGGLDYDSFDLYELTSSKIPVGSLLTTDTGKEYIKVSSTRYQLFNDGEHNHYLFPEEINFSNGLVLSDKSHGTKIVKIEILDSYKTFWKEYNKEVKEMTISEISRILGYEVKIVKGDNE